jgi:S1-C subfamily serine protease
MNEHEQQGQAGPQSGSPWPGYQYSGQYGWQPGGYPTPPPPPRPRFGRNLGLALGATGLALVLGAGFLGWSLGSGHGSFGAAGSPRQAGGGVQQIWNTPSGSADPSAAVQKVVPGLVDVNTELGLQNGRGAGTGIVLTADGEILTNNHVVEGATKISVTDIGNGQTYDATVVGYDRTEDVAVLKLSNASGLATAPIGDSGKVAVGDQIAGVGNAGGAGGAPSVAPGQVTGLGKSITATDDSAGTAEQLAGLIQIAADIQPGDSGGALVNAAGQVVGMDTAASTSYQLGQRGGNGGNSGSGGSGGSGTAAQGFAIPINQALSIANQIESGPASATVHLGETAILGVSVGNAGGSGVAIGKVLSGGPAEQAGLAEGDVVTTLDGQPVASANALTTAMDRHHPGDKVTLGWTDQQGQAHTATVPLATGPVG